MACAPSYLLYRRPRYSPSPRRHARAFVADSTGLGRDGDHHRIEVVRTVLNRAARSYRHAQAPVARNDATPDHHAAGNTATTLPDHLG
jgi:hypothetical protein